MHTVVLALTVVPLAGAVVAFWGRVRVAQAATVVSGLATFGLSVALVGRAGEQTPITVGHWLRVDALSVVFLLSVTFLYAATTVYSVGYLKADAEADDYPRYARRFFAGLNLFAWSMVLAPLVDGLALLWVAIEVTTVVSALLVAIDDTDGATEAAWKYVLIASMGLGIALLATIFMYYAGTTVFGSAYDLRFGPLLEAAHRLPPDAVRLAYVLAVLGFGTKVGLVPVHTWLPDAHSEAPTPVSALLSGSLLAVSFYAILRYFQIAQAALGPGFARGVLVFFGVASLVLAALYLLAQRDLKRLLAYSSVEHMGILALGTSFGGPLALTGVLLHVLAHTAAKGTAFFGAGTVVRKLHTKDMAEIRGGVSVLPWSGPMLLLAILALSALPPFGIFRSEFLIVQGGIADPHYALAATLVVFVTVAFFGMSSSGVQILLTPPAASVQRGEVSAWMVAPMVAALAALLVLGVHPPVGLEHLLARAVATLGGAS